jgi:hypothetical protein
MFTHLSLQGPLEQGLRQLLQPPALTGWPSAGGVRRVHQLLEHSLNLLLRELLANSSLG